jgi:hypothetical protein
MATILVSKDARKGIMDSRSESENATHAALVKPQG